MMMNRQRSSGRLVSHPASAPTRPKTLMGSISENGIAPPPFSGGGGGRASRQPPPTSSGGGFNRRPSSRNSSSYPVGGVDPLMRRSSSAHERRLRSNQQPLQTASQHRGQFQRNSMMSNRMAGAVPQIPNGSSHSNMPAPPRRSTRQH